MIKRKKAKGTKKCFIKRIIKLQVTNYKLQMFNFISNRSKIPDHPYKILIIGGPGSGKTNALLNLINHEPDFVIC